VIISGWRVIRSHVAHCDTLAEIARTLQADIQRAQADPARRQAEYEDLKGRVAYDVRVTWLDLTAYDSSVKVAKRNSAMLHGKTIL
jgi:hypothetical protein